ncbi:MAG TPA: hypothetical protein DF712_21350, partial [Balneola sp.]|nr:hypothetical protein [Balneola sp.]
MNNYMREGYLSNAVLHRCINLIAGEIAKIPLVLKNEKLEPIDNINDPLLKLLSNPNLEQSKVEFINSVMINYLIYGNAYIRGSYESSESNYLPQTKLPILLDVLDPLLMKKKDGCWEYGVGHNAVKYLIGLDGNSNILHLKGFSNSGVGVSTIKALESQINQINLSNDWNNNILQNSGNVSSVIEMSGDTNLTAQ